MKKHSTAPSVRTKRTRSNLSYGTLEDRKLLAADLSPTMAVAQVCEAPQAATSEKLKESTSAADTFFESRQSAEVTDVTVGDGTSNRSSVESITIEFDSKVQPEPGAFELLQRETGRAVDVDWTIDDSTSTSTVTLTFDGRLTGPGGSLNDGNYQLTVKGDLLGGSTASDDFVFGDKERDNLFRYFGDTSGDRDVDVFELLELRSAWLSTQGDARFDARFDANADKVINVVDLLPFRQNYSQNLEWV